MAQMERNSNCLTARIVFAVLGSISGVTIFVSFVVLKNINAAAWGLLSTVFAVTVLRLHLAHRRGTFLEVFSQKTLRLVKQFGAFGSFTSIVAAVTYCTLAIVLKQGYKVENDGYMPACIFSLMTLKWTAFLYCHSSYYEKLYFPDSETKPIAIDEPSSKSFSFLGYACYTTLIKYINRVSKMLTVRPTEMLTMLMCTLTNYGDEFRGYKVENDGYMPAFTFPLMTLNLAASVYCRSRNYEKLYFPDSETKPIAIDEPTSKAVI